MKENMDKIKQKRQAQKKIFSKPKTTQSNLHKELLPMKTKTRYPQERQTKEKIDSYPKEKPEWIQKMLKLICNQRM